MTITLDLRTEETLRSIAAKSNLPVETVIQRMVEDAACHTDMQRTGQVASQTDKSLFELAEPVRGLFTDEEIDALFQRTRSFSRPIDLA